MAFKSDIEIAQATTMAPIGQIASSIGLTEDELEYYGKYKAKVDYNLLKTKYKDTPNGKLILVTAINPTPAGEGKTTTTVGLGDALHQPGQKSGHRPARALFGSCVRRQRRRGRRRLCPGGSYGRHQPALHR